VVISLKNKTKHIIPEALESIINAYKYSFNPSYLKNNNLHYFSIRLYDKIENKIIAMLYIWGENENISSINLTAFFKEKEGLTKVSDPKLLILNDIVYCTFNTGYSPLNANKILLIEIQDKTIINYSFCSYKNRNRVEKNWAFYTLNLELYCVYNLYPLIILKAIKTTQNNIEFVEFFNNKAKEDDSYTLGTPVLKFGNELIFIAHKKISKKGKRLYLGKPFTIILGEIPKLVSKKAYLYHSVKALFGSKHKFNKNLFSCIYFSGISIVNSKICLSYGINDVRWKTVLIEKKQLWH